MAPGAATPPALYQPPTWLPGGHLQTVWPACAAARPPVSYRREYWTTPDDDLIALDWCGPVLNTPGHRPLVVLLHGLEGSSQSHYARALMAQVAERDHAGVVIHFRGCGGSLNQAPRSYHSGDSEELDWILQRLRSLRQASGRDGPLWVAGVSLGGNVLLKWLGERGTDAQFISSAVAVSPPQDLQAAAERLSRGLSRLYLEHFLRSLRAKALAMLARHPGLLDRERVLQARSFFDFDNCVTGPLHGFAGAIDYWTRCSSRPFLAHITVPTLVINALNDPFLPAHALADARAVAPAVELEYPAAGGHVGFPVAGPAALSWLPDRLYAFWEGRPRGIPLA